MDVPKEYTAQAQKLISYTYGRNATNFPLGIKMRYVKTYNKELQSFLRKDIIVLRSKQDWFLNSISHGNTWELTQIDNMNKNDHYHLRQTLMNLQTTDKKSYLFLGINRDERENSFAFTFPTKFEDDARDMIAQLAPYIIFQHDESALKYLTPEADKRAIESPWDETLNRDISDTDRITQHTKPK